MLKHANLPAELWAEAVTTAVYLENITPLASRQFKTAHELWYGTPPTYSHLRTFGCLVYVHICKERQNGKFSDAEKRGLIIGYQDGMKNYRIWLLNEKRIIYSHEVIFNESLFPFKNQTISSFSDSDESNEPTSISTVTPSPDNDGLIISPGIVKGGLLLDNQTIFTLNSEYSIKRPENPEDLVDLSRSSFDTATSPVSPLQSTTSSKLISRSIDDGNIPSHRRRAAQASALAATGGTTPKTYLQATRLPDADLWLAAIEKELNSLQTQNVSEEVELPDGQHAIGTTWVFCRKTNADNELVKYKARLCAPGFSQIKGIDFSLVALGCQ